MEYKPHNYQLMAIEHVLKTPKAGIFLDMGMGKGSVAATALVELIEGFEIAKPLIIGPKLVVEQMWPAELAKWDHTRHLKVVSITGTERDRKMALMRRGDVYLISRDNVAWLVNQMKKPTDWKFDMLIIDELSSFKNNTSMRFKALRKVAPLCHRVVGLTGTPAPNSLQDLWAQIYLLDRGERLGPTISRYREAYFRPKPNGFGYEVRQGCEKFIHERISDICISMQAKDYLDLPKRIDVTRKVKLARMDKYKEFVKEEVLKLETAFDQEITPLSAGALYNKLLQFCNGAVYDENKNVHEVDETKLHYLAEAVEELQGKPCLIFYQFQSDIPRILKFLGKGAEVLDGAESVRRWNKGEIRCLLLHAASAGHGLNMQDGGHHIFWFGLPWGLELYQQAVARLDRQGQKFTVVNTRFVCEGTVEELVEARLGEKALSQGELIEALKKHVL